VPALTAVFSIPALSPTGLSLPAQWASSGNLEQQSARQRFFWWRAAAVLLRAHPVAGAGLGNFVREFPPAARRVFAPWADLPPAFADHPHDDFLFILCEHGVIGLGLLGWVAAAWLAACARGARRGGLLPLGALAGATGLAVPAVWHMPSLLLPTLVTAAGLFGIVASPRIAAPGDARRPSAPVLAAGLALVLALAWRPAVLLVAQSYFNGARILHEDRQEGPAAFLARQSLRLTRAPWRTFFLLGSIHYAQGYYTEAFDAFRADERENPWGADALLHQGKALRQLGRYDEADALGRRALALVPNYPEAAVTLASLAYFRATEARKAGHRAEMGRHLIRARVWLTYALRYFPRNAEAGKLLGFVAILEERWDDARAAWARSVAANPKDDALRAKLEDLDRHLAALKRGWRPRP
ncbi:MAG: tetratricopeptide repeat protein, partial [bacterium]